MCNGLFHSLFRLLRCRPTRLHEYRQFLFANAPLGPLMAVFFGVIVFGFASTTASFEVIMSGHADIWALDTGTSCSFPEEAPEDPLLR
jgi:hypothetical protein